MLKVVLNFLFPQRCLGCGADKEILCQRCLEKIDHADLPEQKNIFAAANYKDEVLKKAVWLFKYKNVSQLAKPLAELIKKRVWLKIVAKNKNYTVVPIPLSSKRFRQRGYNQAELLARELSENVLTNVLVKNKNTESQVKVKDKEKRLINIKGSFETKNTELIVGKNIILIDDICTTGATIAEARKILKEAGAKKVSAAVVARG